VLVRVWCIVVVVGQSAEKAQNCPAQGWLPIQDGRVAAAEAGIVATEPAFRRPAAMCGSNFFLFMRADRLTAVMASPLVIEALT